MNRYYGSWKEFLAFSLLLLGAISAKECHYRSRDVPELKPHQQGFAELGKDKREYFGMVRKFRDGSEQKIYIDRKPFGSLDGVRIEQYVNGLKNVLEERKPEMHEEDTFRLLEHYASRNVF